MQTGHKQASQEQQRAEMEAVLQSMGQSSRLAILLRHICEMQIEGQTDQLNEYCIATAVFGRAKTTFNASEDAIVRVEAHRLRKRLKEYYAGPGRNHAIQIVLPTGTYIPSFRQVAAAPGLAPLPIAAAGTEPGDASPLVATEAAELPIVQQEQAAPA